MEREGKEGVEREKGELKLEGGVCVIGFRGIDAPGVTHLPVITRMK